MSTATLPTVSPSGILSLANICRISVDEYHRMILAGILTTEHRIELLDGYLVNKMPQDTPHSSTISRLDEDLKRIVGSGGRVRVQLPVTLPESEPEPDVAVVRGDRRAFDSRQPAPADFGIVCEVSDSTLALDRKLKCKLYASESIPEYWIVNIPDRQIEVYTHPDPAAGPPAYHTRTDYPAGLSVPVVLDGVAVGSIGVAGLLP